MNGRYIGIGPQKAISVVPYNLSLIMLYDVNLCDDTHQLNAIF